MNANARESILGRVRSALAPLPQRAAYPDWSDDLPVMPAARAAGDLWTLFCERLHAVHGEAFEGPAGAVERLLAGGWLRGYCDPLLLPQWQNFFGTDFTVETRFDRTRIDDYAFGITRASGAIAETGTLILSDRETSSRLAALAPWVHVAVLPGDRLYRTVGEAVAQLGDDPNVIWVTGPSKTADVEGILIEGVHGPGVQWAVRGDR
jgi:L-lactate dehydrogenase complex protein LldG